MRRRRHGGGVLLETALWLPVLLLCLLGTLEFARLTYTYHTLKKILYDLARYASTQQGLNFCDSADATVALAKAMAITGTPDGSGSPQVPNLTVEQISLRIERYSASEATLVECSCEASSSGCDSAAGAPPPDYLVATLPEGYPVTLRVPGLAATPINQRPPHCSDQISRYSLPWSFGPRFHIPQQ